MFGMVADTATKRTLLMGCPFISRSLRVQPGQAHSGKGQGI